MPLRNAGNLDQDSAERGETESDEREPGLPPSPCGSAVDQSDSKVGFSAGYSPRYRVYAAS